MAGILRPRRESIRRLRRQLKRRAGQTGVLAVGRFSLTKLSNSAATRGARVSINAKKKMWLHQSRRGPRRIGLKPDTPHTIDVFVPDADEIHNRVNLSPGEIRVLFVEPLRNGKVTVRLVTPETLGLEYSRCSP